MFNEGANDMTLFIGPFLKFLTSSPLFTSLDNEGIGLADSQVPSCSNLQRRKQVLVGMWDIRLS